MASSGGVFRLVEYAGSLVAEAVEGSDRVPIAEGDRCLICLSDYEAAEEIRQLARCKHLFHKDCIDQVCSIQLYTAILRLLDTNCPYCSGLPPVGTHVLCAEARGYRSRPTPRTLQHPNPLHQRQHELISGVLWRV